MLSRIHSALNDSKTLDSVAVRDIGLMSLLMSCTGRDLGIGITSATFHCEGT